jgi:carbon storage regulator CsrA
MLVLSRKKGEETVLKIGDMEIKIVVVSINGNRTQLGIAAPKHVRVKRGELLEADIKEGSSEATPLESPGTEA